MQRGSRSAVPLASPPIRAATGDLLVQRVARAAKQGLVDVRSNNPSYPCWSNVRLSLVISPAGLSGSLVPLFEKV